MDFCFNYPSNWCFGIYSVFIHSSTSFSLVLCEPNENNKLLMVFGVVAVAEYELIQTFISILNQKQNKRRFKVKIVNIDRGE